jgi:hypothetical protein
MAKCLVLCLPLLLGTRKYQLHQLTLVFLVNILSDRFTNTPLKLNFNYIKKCLVYSRLWLFYEFKSFQCEDGYIFVGCVIFEHNIKLSGRLFYIPFAFVSLPKILTYIELEINVFY